MREGNAPLLTRSVQRLRTAGFIFAPFKTAITQPVPNRVCALVLSWPKQCALKAINYIRDRIPHFMTIEVALLLESPGFFPGYFFGSNTVTRDQKPRIHLVRLVLADRHLIGPPHHALK